MARIAYVLLADTETPGDMGRAVNALEGALESIEEGDEVRIIFDGAGTKWVGALADEDHDYHDLYARVEDHVAGACQYCAGAYGVKNAVKRARVPLIDEHDGHPSLRGLVADGFHVITF